MAAPRTSVQCGSSGRPHPAGHEIAPDRPVEGCYEIASGVAELVRDRRNPAGWLLVVNGLDSSYVDLADPTHLEFEYIAWMAAAVDAHTPGGAPLRVVHLGGGGCTLPRYLAAARPGSEQLVFEVDPILIALVTEAFELAEIGGLELRHGEAGDGLRGLAPRSYDIIVRDAFLGGSVPRHLTTPEFLSDVERVLTAEGLYLANVPAGPDLQAAEAEAAVAATAFKHVSMLVDQGQFHARRFGNVLLAASSEPLRRERLEPLLAELGIPAYLVVLSEIAGRVLR